MGPGQEKIDALNRRMEKLNIRKEDIQEKFIKSSGRGGQKVNKSSSAVFIKHLPTGISVKYGKDRSRHLNRFMAKRLLVERLEARITGEKTEKEARREKIKKQKMKRKKRSKHKHQ
ncbi:MAG: peptide chain release factor-like protein [Desulfarculaceae bacterium]|nr:peptide chain release factor-like protein [Desulfarculaceae bacterium]